MTMDYLVTTVMDDYRERPADWYDFVWNRTRGIRKVELNTHTECSLLPRWTNSQYVCMQDITLQHLCSVETAELTEKCAR